MAALSHGRGRAWGSSAVGVGGWRCHPSCRRHRPEMHPHLWRRRGSPQDEGAPRSKMGRRFDLLHDRPASIREYLVDDAILRLQHALT